MKKGLLIGALVGLVVGALVAAGFAYAQTPTPVPQFPDGQGGMGRYQKGGTGQGMRGGFRGEGQFGPMHDYMMKAMAEALGIKQADLEASLKDGKTIWQFAQDKGLTQEQFQKAMLEARSQALKEMVADGVITQAQADWMLSRMQNMGGRGGGRFGGQGGCPGMGGSGGGSRWSTPPTQSAPSTSTSNG